MIAFDTGKWKGDIHENDGMRQNRKGRGKKEKTVEKVKFEKHMERDRKKIKPDRTM